MKLSFVGGKKSLLKPTAELTQFLKSAGMNPEAIAVFIALLQPLLVDYVGTQILDQGIFNHGEISALELTIIDNKLDEEQGVALYEAAYKQKTGQDVNVLVEQFYAEFIEMFKQVIKDSADVLQQLSAVPESDMEQKLQEFIDQKLDSYTQTNE